MSAVSTASGIVATFIVWDMGARVSGQLCITPLRRPFCSVTAARRDYEPVRAWARSFSLDFLAATETNPMVWVEALFWRPEKGANAELSRHYGLIDGAALAGLSGAELSALLSAGGAKSLMGKPSKPKHRSRAALDADEAEAEAARNRAAAAAGGADDDEAVASFSDDSSSGSSSASGSGDDGAAAAVSRAGKRKRLATMRKRRLRAKAKRGASNGRDDDAPDSTASKRRRSDSASSQSDEDDGNNSAGDWSAGEDAALRTAFPRAAGLLSMAALASAASDSDASRDEGIASARSAGRDGMLAATILVRDRSLRLRPRRSAAAVLRRATTLGVVTAPPIAQLASSKRGRIHAAVDAVIASRQRRAAAAAGAGWAGDDAPASAAEAELEEADGDAAVRWLASQLQRAAAARASLDALRGRSATARVVAPDSEGSDSDGSDREGRRFDDPAALARSAARLGAPLATAPDVPLVAWTPLQDAWFQDAAFQALLREVGAVPAVPSLRSAEDNGAGGRGAADVLGWRLPSALPTATLAATGNALQNAQERVAVAALPVASDSATAMSPAAPSTASNVAVVGLARRAAAVESGSAAQDSSEEEAEFA